MPTSLLTVAAQVKALLGTVPGLHVDESPAEDLPTDANGLIVPSAVVDMTPGADRYTRLNGARAGRAELVTIYATGPHKDGCLWVCGRVRDALAGVRLPSGGLLREDSYLGVPPTVEPGTGPARVSVPLTFTTITKRGS